MSRIVALVLFCVMIVIWRVEVKAEFFSNTGSYEYLTRAEVRRIFLFYEKFWPRTSQKITIILPPPDSTLFKLLATKELGVSPTYYLNGIVVKNLDGTIDHVIFAETESAVLFKINSTPNSIGYYYDGIKFRTDNGVISVTIID